jgi:acyl carrier protein
MTGIPTNGVVTADSGEVYAPVGTPQHRYRLQHLFYARMRALCESRSIPFLDLCTPLIGDSGFVDSRMLFDDVHLDHGHRHLYLDLLDRCFGFVDDTPATSDATSPEWAWTWDGSYEHYLTIARATVRRLAPASDEPDFEHLMSTGALDSLSLMEVVAMLEAIFYRKIDLNTIRRSHFESLSGIYRRFFGPVPDAAGAS